MKKLIAAILCAALLPCICGCEKEEAVTGNDVPTLKNYQIGAKPEGWDAVLDEFNKKTEAAIGAKTQWEFISTGSYSEKMNVIMAAGEEFDVCYTGFVNPIASAVNNGAFMPLDDLMKEHAPNLYNTMPKYWWDVVTFDGEIYAVPNQQVAAMPSGVWVFKRFADKYGFDMNGIKCLKDIEPMLEVIKQNEPDLWPFRAAPGVVASFFGETANDYETVTTGLCIRKDDKKAKLLNYYELPEFYDGIETMNRWWKKGYIRKDIVSVMDDTSDFKAKKYVFNTGNWKPGVEAEMLSSYGEESVMSIYNKGYVSTSSCDSTMFAISRTSKNAEQAMKLINYLNTDAEGYNLFATGLEDVNYEKLDDGRIKVKEGNTYPIGSGWKWGNQFNAYVTDAQEPDVWEQTKKLNEEAEVSPIMGFRANTDSILTEIAQVEAVVAEFSAIQYDDYEKLYPEFLNRLEKAGLPKIKEEYQKQINEFLKNN